MAAKRIRKGKTDQLAAPGAPTPSDFKPGLYKHYKGGLYRALMLVSHHDTGEHFVAYVSMDHATLRIREWASLGKDSWTDPVWIDGKGFVPRFAYVRP